jgi:hypothetical protein
MAQHYAKPPKVSYELSKRQQSASAALKKLVGMHRIDCTGAFVLSLPGERVGKKPSPQSRVNFWDSSGPSSRSFINLARVFQGPLPLPFLANVPMNYALLNLKDFKVLLSQPRKQMTRLNAGNHGSPHPSLGGTSL